MKRSEDQGTKEEMEESRNRKKERKEERKEGRMDGRNKEWKGGRNNGMNQPISRTFTPQLDELPGRPTGPWRKEGGEGRK